MSRLQQGGPMSYDGELASSILLDDGDGLPDASAGGGERAFYGDLIGSGPSLAIDRRLDGVGRGGRGGGSGVAAPGSTRHSTRGLAPHQRADGEAPDRTPTRTPSPVYQWNHQKVGFGGEDDDGGSFPPGERLQRTDKSSSSTSGVNVELYQQVPFPSYFPPYWAGGMNPQAYYGMMMGNPLLGQKGEGKGIGMDPQTLQMMMASAAASGHGAQDSGSGASGSFGFGGASMASEGLQLPVSPGPRESGGLALMQPRGGGAASGRAADGKRTKSRNEDRGDRGAPGGGGGASGPAPQASVRDRGGGAKGERRRRGGGDVAGEESGGAAAGGRGSGKSRSADIRPGSNNPLIEALKARDRSVELSELAPHIAEIAQDQYGSRLIQQKLEVANEDEKALAFKSVLQKMQQLTTDVFGNYVIQKFFEYGTAEQRRILAEQLVGQVLQLSLHMYGCRVVQKALDSVPIEQQVLLIGELKGNVLACIEDQHGNHVIQKCIERLPTDRIGFIVDSFLGQTNRMAKHCYGCRVIQRLIEYCASAQISLLLDEALRSCLELATDQYGNYVVQHVMEHSSRPGDRQSLMQIVRKNILSLSCHKYASNVIEKALGCGTLEEKALLIQAIVGEPSDSTPPLLTMMRDRFGNYIVQRVIGLAQGAQRDALFWRLTEHMPALKKSNAYGRHIISALERAQPPGSVG
mmetsp:Transcript_12986/g.37396  ORF Transcript_12986/g.37396 Transcript_12986/m.37396 type:complete len:692 (+) Transcript_12986:114-2189(+)